MKIPISFSLHSLYVGRQFFQHPLESATYFLCEKARGCDFPHIRRIAKNAEENGCAINPNTHVWVAYDCHAEYSTPPHTCYAYLPYVPNEQTLRMTVPGLPNGCKAKTPQARLKFPGSFEPLHSAQGTLIPLFEKRGCDAAGSTALFAFFAAWQTAHRGCYFIPLQRRAAFKIVVHIVGDEPCAEIAPVAHGIRRTGNVQIFRQNELDAANRNVAA